MKKGDLGMAKRFSKKYGTRDELSTTCNLKKLCQDACQRLMLPTSLHHCLQNYHQYCTFLS